MTTMEQIKRVNLSRTPISHMLKEAVADGLLHDVFLRLSGHGLYGKYLYGGKPSRVLVSEFLIPSGLGPSMSGPRDEENSPIEISSCGLDLKLHADQPGIVHFNISFSIYVRILPTTADLRGETPGADIGPVPFFIRRELNREIRFEVRERRSKEYSAAKKEKKKYDWRRRSAELYTEVARAKGVRAISNPRDDVRRDDETEDITIDSDMAKLSWTVKPGDTHVMDNAVAEPQDVPMKWLRLEVGPVELEFEVATRSPEEEATVIGQFTLRSQIILRDAIRKRIVDWLESEDPLTGGRLWAYPKRNSKFLPSQIQDWESTLLHLRSGVLSESTARKMDGLIALPSLAIELALDCSADWGDRNVRTLRIALENNSLIPQRNKLISEEGIFQVEIKCWLPKEMHHPLRLERVKPSYRYNRYLAYAALGFNCAVESEDVESGMVVLRTTWLPRYTLPVLSQTTHGVDLKFEVLKDQARTLNAIEGIPDRFRDWISSLDGVVDVTDGLAPDDGDGAERERRKFEEDKRYWHAEAESIDRGIKVLRKSSSAPAGSLARAPFDAWLAMNEAMHASASGRFEEWRLFQVAFILANLGGFASRVPGFEDYYNPEEDEKVSLLYFPTGGGKSEAFFGLLVFCLFLDRLRGKGLGVTAVIRYPLRLLTIQQGQRATLILAKAEEVRRRRSISGEPFSVGFWVGGANTPNRTNEATVIPFASDERSEETLRSEDEKYVQAVTDWLKLPRCPFCGSQEMGLRRFGSGDMVVLGHVCLDESCSWKALEPGAPLPFYIVDQDIYAKAPSVVLGTVDKLALIAQHPSTIRKVLGMFGFAGWYDPASKRIITESRPERIRNLPAGLVKLAPGHRDGELCMFDPYPCLEIQDEAHLLDESLGTFSGLFETLFSSMLNALAPLLGDHVVKTPGSEHVRRSKIIAASATVSEPERQAQVIYQRGVTQFPHPGRSLYESFYARPCEPDEESVGPAAAERSCIPEVELRALRRRTYASILTNGKMHTVATTMVLATFHLIVSDYFTALASLDDSEVGRVKSALCLAQRKSSLTDLYRATIERATPTELATLIDLHRICLTYVTNKKGGDQVGEMERDETIKLHDRLAPSVGLENLDTRFITGSVNIGDIQDTVNAVKSSSHRDYFANITNVLRSIIATSAISHGVDVEEMNSMVFAGMPSDVAEYIQASSRVGRTHVGFCLLLPIPQRRRDRFIVEVHEIYHRFLERMVLPAAVERFADAAIRRVVPSLLQAWFCGVKGVESFCHTEAKDKHRNYAVTNQILSYMEPVSDPANEFIAFASRAVGLEGAGLARCQYYEDLLRGELRRILDQMRATFPEGALPDFFEDFSRRASEMPVKPMTSLRDIDLPGVIVSAHESVPRASKEVFVETMRFLRRGGGTLIDAD